MTLKNKHLAKKLLFYIPLTFYFLSPIYINATTQDTNSRYTHQHISNENKFTLDSIKSKLLLKTKKRLLRNDGDTLKIISFLISQSDKNKNIGKYSRSFDFLWEALYLSKNSNYLSQETKITRRIGQLYEIYNLNDAAIQYLEQSLSIAKKVSTNDPDYAFNLIASYMNLAMRQRNLGNYSSALSYLDTCFHIKNQYENDEISFSYLDAERGRVLLQQGELNEALKYLQRANQQTKGKKITYRANIYLYLGELYEAMNKTDSAIFCYNQSKKHINKQNLHYSILPDVLLKLSEIYKKKNRLSIAYKLLYRSQAVRDSLFRLQLNSNSELFEIKDSYLKALKKKDEFISQQNKELKYQKLIQDRLSIILALSLLLGGTAVLIIRMRLKLNKTLLEKKNTELQSKLEQEKIKAEMEVKSKELTSYALQMIDKDSAIDELLEAIKKDAPQSYKPLQAKYQKGAKDLWDQFNLRFTEVNTAFYSRLNDKHPELSPTEQKHCALIKLNFGTKEMARILNIAPHSVHISRSRIRKKIGLERSENLEKYIANL